MNDYYPYPIFLNLNDRDCVVVGGGSVAKRKIMDLLEAGAGVTVVAEKFDPLIMDIVQKGKIKLIKRNFKPQDIENAFIVFATTDDNAINVEIAEIVLMSAIYEPYNVKVYDHNESSLYKLINDLTQAIELKKMENSKKSSKTIFR